VRIRFRSTRQAPRGSNHHQNIANEQNGAIASHCPQVSLATLPEQPSLKVYREHKYELCRGYTFVGVTPADVVVATKGCKLIL